jgi:hypothetical protein
VDEECFRNMTKLEELREYSPFVGPESVISSSWITTLANLTNLKKLRLDSVFSGNCIQEIQSNNLIDDDQIEVFSRLQNLEKLECILGPTTFAMLAKFPKLHFLRTIFWLFETRPSATLPSFAKMYYNRLDSESDFRDFLHTFKDIKELFINGIKDGIANSIVNSLITLQPKLEHLVIPGLIDSEHSAEEWVTTLQSFKALTNLKFLSFGIRCSREFDFSVLDFFLTSWFPWVRIVTVFNCPKHHIHQIFLKLEDFKSWIASSCCPVFASFSFYQGDPKYKGALSVKKYWTM